jgi:natural product precursor
MKKTTNFDAFAQFADARLSKEEMKMIKGGTEPRDFEGGNPGGGGSGTGGGNVGYGSWICYHDMSYPGGTTTDLGGNNVKAVPVMGDVNAVNHCSMSHATCLGCEPA